MSESKADDVVILPRPFKLRIEANAAAGKKAQTYLKAEHAQFISYGLYELEAKEKADPTFDVMGYWQGIIIGIQNKPCGEVIYQWACKVPRNYPEAPPLIPNFKWNPTLNIADVLMAIREAMKDKSSIDASYRLIGQEFFQLPGSGQIASAFN